MALSRLATEDQIRNALLESLDDTDHQNDIGNELGGSDSENEMDNVETDDIVDSECSDREEISEDSEEGNSLETEQRLNQNFLYGKKGYKWSIGDPPRRGRTRAEDLVVRLPGLKGNAKSVKTPLEAWELLVNSTILECILVHTNEEIIRRKATVQAIQSYHQETTLVEVRAFIGLLYFCAANKDTHVNLEDLWSPRFGHTVYRSTMSQRRFEFLASVLRFDDKTTRPQRKIGDNFAAIRQVWDIFIDNCKSSFTPYSYCTIDEQLMGYRGNCPFRVYIANKPDKYGIKILMLNCSKTFYMVNAIPYIGRVATENREPVPSFYVRTLSEPIHNTHRNITVDNWFSSVPLFDKMYEEYGLTMVGTLRKNKVEVPPTFLKCKEIGEAQFAFDKNKTLVSFTPKKNKIVLMLSTHHYSKAIDEITKKPEVIITYNETKGGTDTFDQLCHSFTTARATRRWPMRVFLGVLDGSGINAYIIFKHANTNFSTPRRKFLQELSWSLLEPHLQQRVGNPQVRRGIRLILEEMLGTSHNIPQRAALPNPNKRVRCGICPREKDKKTKFYCERCHVPVCEEHRGRLCCNF